MVATAIATPADDDGSAGSTSPRPAAGQSGRARNARHDVGDERQAEGQQDVLDAVEAAREHQHRHGDGGDRHAAYRLTPRTSAPSAIPAISAHSVPRLPRTSAAVTIAAVRAP